MATLEIEGQRVQVGDEFLSLPKEQQDATVAEIAASLKPSKVGVSDVVRATATGVPLVGGIANKLNAATNAALAPVVEPFLEKGPETLDQPTFKERYAKSLELQNAKDARFAKEHPVVDTAAKIAGGVGGTIPLVMAAPAAFGVTGTLPSQVVRGSTSGAALSGADAAIRGEDVAEGAGIGGALGAAGPLAAKAIGAVVNKVRPTPPPVPQHTVKVGDVDVPLRPDQVTGDVAAAAEAETSLRGGHGDAAQRVAQEFEQSSKDAIQKASDDLAAKLDPTGAVLKTSPQEAGERVAGELADREATRLATERAATQRAAQEGERIRATVGGQVDATGQPVRTVDSPFAAAEAVGGGVQDAAQAARAARTAAYREYAAVPGEFEPAGFTQVGNSIRQRLSAGESPVRVTENLTPNAHQALNILDENVGTLRFQNDAQTGAQILDASGRPQPRPITGQTIEEARKELTQLYGDARRAAMGPGGNQADVRAMDRIIQAFDNHVQDVARAGGFSGDAAALQAAGERARASHASYRRLFSRQGPGDEVGTAVEKIIGRYEGQAATPDQIAALSYGSVSDPGGAMPIKIAQRIRTIFGEDSPQYAAYKEGLVSHVIDDIPGSAARTPAQIADRIDRFLDGTKGRGLAQVALNAEDRAALRAHAETLRASEPVPLASLNSVDKVVSRISGRDGSGPMSPGEVADLLLSSTMRTNKKMAVPLMQTLKRDLSPESWTGLRQAMWERITNAGEGRPAFESAALTRRISEFLDLDVAKVFYSQAERDAMKQLATVHRQMVPPKGTTNPSGTAPMLARIANRASSNVLAMLGAAHSGFPGLAAGYAADKAVRSIQSARNARAAVERSYGVQPKRVASSSRVPIVLAQALGTQQAARQ